MEYTADLREQSWGDWEGKTFDYLLLHHSDELKKQVDAGWDFCPPGGESRRQVLVRALAVVKDITDRFSEDSHSYAFDINKYINLTSGEVDSTVDISIMYNDSDLGDIDENTLAIYRYEETWTPIVNSTVDTLYNTVWVTNITDFGIFAILVQLGIAQDLILALFYGVVGFIALAGGLAFGLGGKEVAQDLLRGLVEKLKK